MTGSVAPDETGIMLPREHVMSIFGGGAVYRTGYDGKKLFAAAMTHFSSRASIPSRVMQ